MSDFPRTRIEDLSVSRLIIGSNWFLGYSHTSQAKDRFIKEHMTRPRIAEILEVFFRAGVDTIMGVRPEATQLEDAIRDAEQRTGRGCIRIGTPTLELDGSPAAADANARLLDGFAAIGSRVCMPHQCSTDALLDRRTRTIREIDRYTAMIRRRGMIPGLSTHMPEAVVYADESGLDVGTYIQIYNAAGFLMQVEIDWVHRIIHGARRPVITIKPLAAGRLLPLVGLGFSWATIRPQDMVCIGTMTADEAREAIDLSQAIIHARTAAVPLQRTRSKASIEKAKA